jgi:hypothetical protein
LRTKKLSDRIMRHGCVPLPATSPPFAAFAVRTCAEPEHIDCCPLPSHDLRNGHLNQAAYSLFLFIRDIADGDLIGWIDAA